MHYPITDMQVNLGSIALLDIKLPQKDIDTDRQTDARQTDTDNRYFLNAKNKCMRCVRAFFCCARMYSGNSARLNKKNTKNY